MNTIYIIFISVIVISFILGLFVTFFKSKYNMKLHKYNNYALEMDNYEYAKDYLYKTNEYNFSDEINNQEEKNIKENTIVIPLISEKEEEIIIEEISEPIIYSIMDDEIIW